MARTKMKAISIITLVMCCIGVESFTGVREKRETTVCSSGFIIPPPGKVYKVSFFGDNALSWQEAREACQDLGGELAEASTREEENKILAAFDKAMSDGTIRWDWRFWIGVKKGNQEGGSLPEWVSGKKVGFDTDLTFAQNSGWNVQYWASCGTIEDTGINFFDCKQGRKRTRGYVCEFTNPSPICIQ